MFGIMGSYYFFGPCQATHFSLIDKETQWSCKNGALGQPRGQSMKENCYNVMEKYEYDWWKLYKRENFVKRIVGIFPP